MRTIMAVVTSTAAAMALLPAAAQAGGCKSSPGYFSLRVTGTSCPTGRSVQRAYSAADCYTPSCVVTARDERWRCRPKILRNSGIGVSGPNSDTVVRGQVRCYRLRDQAIATWQYSGAGA